MTTIFKATHNRARHVESPERRSRVGSNSLEDCHFVLLVLSVNGTLHVDVHLLLGLDIVSMVDMGLIGLGL